MDTTGEPPRPALWAVLLLATAQGLALWYLTEALTESSWPAARPGLYSLLLAQAAFLVPGLYALAQWWQQRRTWLMALGVAALLGLIGYHYGTRLNDLQGRDYLAPDAIFTHFLAGFVLLFHLLPFLQARLAGASLGAYPQLFSFAWRNALRLALAGLFLGLTWLLLLVLAQLFDMLGIDFFKVIFLEDDRMAWLTSSLAFGVGIHLADNSERLLTAVRQQVLGMLKWLVVMSAAILVMFGAALLAKSPELFSSQRHIISASWLLWLALINIYLYNAAFQDGSDPRPLPPLLGRLLRWATPLIAVIAVMACYALVVRVQAYGLTVERVWGLLVGGMVLFYAGGYTLAARRAAPWMASMARVNVVGAILLVFALSMMLTPLLSPYRLTASSLAARLLAQGEQPDETRLAMLRRNTGRYGIGALERLAAADSGASSVLRASAAAALKSDSWNVRVVRAEQPLQMEVQPDGATVEPALRTAIAEHYRVGVAGWCSSQSPCSLLRADVDRDGDLEALLVGEGDALLFRQDARGKWRDGATELQCRIRKCQGASAAAALRSGDYRWVTPTIPDLRLGDWLVRLPAATEAADALATQGAATADFGG